MTREPGCVGFLARRRGDEEYVRRLGRLRWERRLTGRTSAVLDGAAPASEAFRSGESWIVVRAETALPLPGPDPAPGPGEILLASVRPPAASPVVHTLRELERQSLPADAAVAPAPGEAPALAWRVSDFPPRDGERVADYLARLLSDAASALLPSGFAAVVFDDRAGDAREDVTRYLPPTTRRLLDVGCGAGAVSASLRRERPGLTVTGIEKDPALAALAGGALDRVLQSDAKTALAALVEAGERFDGFLLADVLEHLDDPVGVLALVRDLARPGATLVASVPNVGHVSLVRDLVLGRFDPLPAGLADAGHLRWFTRASLEEAIEEAGWRVISIEGLPGASAPESGEFLSRACAWPDADRESLTTYQWIAVATT